MNNRDVVIADRLTASGRTTSLNHDDHDSFARVSWGRSASDARRMAQRDEAEQSDRDFGTYGYTSDEERAAQQRREALRDQQEQRSTSQSRSGQSSLEQSDSSS